MLTPALKEKINAVIEERKKNGYYFKINVPKECPNCKMMINMAPAFCYGVEVGPGWFESEVYENHDCPKEPRVERIEMPTELSTEVKDIAEFVVLCQGNPCFISGDERERYIEAARRGVKVVEIRQYVFDRVYPILPYGEWRNEQERRNKKVAEYQLLEDGY